MTDEHDPDGPLTIRPVTGGRDADAARGLVAEAERDAPHGELVDEGERHRLDRFRRSAEGAPPDVVDAAWQPFLASVGDHPAGYAGVLLDDQGTGASAELVVSPHHRRRGIGGQLLHRLEDSARARGAERIRIWSRDEDQANERFAASRGYDLHRRLLILARGDDPVPDVEPPAGVVVRTHRPGPDDAEVIRVLNAAFPGLRRPWTQARLDDRRELSWFDPEGLLVADRSDEAGPPALLGLHWTKQRGDGVGEVHIMAIAPEGQGMGLGRALLRAGLAHLLASGDHEVILWMDADNEPAKRLYESEGFHHRYADAQYARDLR